MTESLEPIRQFSVARLPQIVFGAGRFAELPAIVRSFGPRVLVVTGAASFNEREHRVRLIEGFERARISWRFETVSGEPSPALVDEIVARNGGSTDVVVGIGGGSALDTAKAVAGLLINRNSVMHHLEGVGPGVPYRGPSVPFVAVPTTAGTGSEATKNAVLTMRGPGAFKKSFRDEQLVARVALIDPDLLATCLPGLIAANGMDAVTQLLEAYVSTGAGPFTDALALSGLEAARDGLLAWFDEASEGRSGPAAAAARSRMAYAALCSGIVLAQAGLGAVHGIASPLGAQFPVPHGVACGAVLVAATLINVSALEVREPENPALARYATAGRLLTGRDIPNDEDARSALVALLSTWRARLGVPRLGAFGVKAAHIPAIVADSRGSSMRTNPVLLADEEIAGILRASI